MKQRRHEVGAVVRTAGEVRDHPVGNIADGRQEVDFAETRGGKRTGEGAVYRLDTELRKLPRETVPVIRALWCRRKSFRAILAHLAALESSFAALKNLGWIFR